MNEYPVIIQGGMGVGVSNWKLAQAVSRTGQLGVVSGTALDQVFSRRLQDGDPDGSMRRALEAFPFPSIAKRVLETNFIPGGKAPGTPYRNFPAHAKDNPRETCEICLCGNFAEVFLAREGHKNPVGINYLEKIQAALLPAIYGAMLAGVDYIIMGAGIPLKVPGVIDGYVHHEPAEYALHVTGAQPDDDVTTHFNPAEFAEGPLFPLKRPMFLAIVSSNTLATTMLKKANGRVDGLVIETKIAGGHNAPPRGKLQLTESGEPIYGERDEIDIPKLRDLGVPFWLAGGYGQPGKLREALALGAAGVQVGTAFEFSAESGLRPDYKRELLDKAIAGNARVFTDPLASPTGFPFKVARLEGTNSEPNTYADRPRICDLGFLRESYRTAEGEVAFRCGAEPTSVFLSKGGHIEDTVGRKCICNALLANVGYAQSRNGNRTENGIVTAGDDINTVARFIPEGENSYTAADVIDQLMSGWHNAPQTLLSDHETEVAVTA